MHILVSVAVSLDGYIDDASSERYMLSSPSDITAVHELRATCDAILVGANTIRRDNPALTARITPTAYPARVTVTKSGYIPVTSNFFSNDPADKVIFYAGSPPPPHNNAEAISYDGNMKSLLLALEKRGVKRLMVEGGSNILTQILSQNLAHEIRLAFAPVFIGDSTAPRFINDGDFPMRRMRVQKTEQFEDTSVIWYDCT